MAKQKAKKPSESNDKERPLPDVPSGYEEVGDYWEKMFAFENKGDFIAGIYRGTVANIGENLSNVHILEVDGERIGVWGSSVLDKRMTSVKLQVGIMIVLEGREVSEKTGRLYKDFKVYQKKQRDITHTNPRDDTPI